ncbi:MAG: peptidylprolyl isomerase [Lachnospiraceae bacterium]|nr:peptidylprolyl isomerase [Lachnospiraceae bacterium]
MHSGRLIPAIVISLALSGCGLSDHVPKIPSPAAALRSVRDLLASDTRVIVTTGPSRDELFRIEDTTCSLQEYLVCLINMQKTCESGFSPDVWAGEEGAAFAESIRDNALARISRIKAMTLLASDLEITLTDDERDRAHTAADDYNRSLSEADRQACGGVDGETLRNMVADYMLADKVYRYYIRDIDPEISDDEARRVTVRQIVLRTWTYDAGGSKVSVDEAGKRTLLLRAKQLRRDWENGADFEDLAAAYNEADETELTFGRGETDPVMESIAFSLGKDEVSEVFETGEGITLLYMINTFDRAETEANKLRIMDERRHDAFDREYDTFAAGLARTFNDEVYERAQMTDDPAVTTSDFFRICEGVCTEDDGWLK